ncbi:MAG: D-alanine--D-alanine ligase [Chloroflexi bacterium]|nr:D-alanine--D-alanine ligase [Chloroflexota bacterium]
MRVGVLFGGRSGEHEVSLLSARGIMGAMDPAKYQIVPIGIAKDGRWIAHGNPMRSLVQGLAAGGSVAVAPPADPTHPVLHVLEGSGAPIQVDVVFPALHGPFGEDGTIQGLLELANLPYVGSGVAASATAMDKILAKAIFAAHGLPVTGHVLVYRGQWQSEPQRAAEQVANEIGFPCFVKPANLGSSVGISKVKEMAQLGPALDEAARFDRKLLVEQGINAREIECSVLGNDVLQASIPGEIVPCREFYDYRAKYVEAGSELLIPAPLDHRTSEEVRRLAMAAYRALDCAGMARVDFLLDRENGRLYLNEVNTIPGFTPISMYPKLWEASGLGYTALIDRLIELALERHADKAHNLTSYPEEGEALVASFGEEA